MTKNIAVVILAAGKGERMKSSVPKVLHEICGRPMLVYVLDVVRSLRINKAVCVLGHQHEEVKKFIPAGVKTVMQKKIVGTADAVKTALTALNNFHGSVLVLYADIPLLKKETLRKLIDYHLKNNSDVTLLTADIKNPYGYGRILRDKYHTICRIVEEKDADDFQKEIKEINTGIVIFNKDKLKAALKSVKPNNRKKEYYLTDIIEIFYKNNFVSESVKIKDSCETLGINSRVELAQANRLMQARLNRQIMLSGVTIIDPDTTFIAHGAIIGEDTLIYPFTVIDNNVKIGKHCRIGPFAHLRAGTRLNNNVWVGNFIETVRTNLGEKAIAKHFCYLGDAQVGAEVNIGAGTVTANFDGRDKHKTVISPRAFIGSDTVLVAPVKIGRCAKTGAGSVVLKRHNVADYAAVAGVPARPLKVKSQ